MPFLYRGPLVVALALGGFLALSSTALAAESEDVEGGAQDPGTGVEEEQHAEEEAPPSASDDAPERDRSVGERHRDEVGDIATGIGRAAGDFVDDEDGTGSSFRADIGLMLGVRNIRSEFDFIDGGRPAFGVYGAFHPIDFVAFRFEVLLVGEFDPPELVDSPILAAEFAALASVSPIGNMRIVGDFHLEPYAVGGLSIGGLSEEYRDLGADIVALNYIYGGGLKLATSFTESGYPLFGLGFDVRFSGGLVDLGDLPMFDSTMFTLSFHVSL